MELEWEVGIIFKMEISLVTGIEPLWHIWVFSLAAVFVCSLWCKEWINRLFLLSFRSCEWVIVNDSHAAVESVDICRLPCAPDGAVLVLPKSQSTYLGGKVWECCSHAFPPKKALHIYSANSETIQLEIIVSGTIYFRLLILVGDFKIVFWCSGIHICDARAQNQSLVASYI